MTRIPLSLDEARACPAFHEALGLFRSSKSKQRKQHTDKLHWEYQVSERLGGMIAARRLGFDERLNEILANSTVYLACKGPGPGQKWYLSTALNYTPNQVRTYYLNREVYSK